MEPWMIVVGLVLLTPVFVLLVRRSNKASADNHKVQVAKWEQLRTALREAHLAFAAKQVTNVEAVDKLITAATHLGPDYWMVHTRRVIGVGDYMARYAEGLELVKKARAIAGV